MNIDQIIILKSIVSTHDNHVENETRDFIKNLHLESIEFTHDIFFIASGGVEGIFLSNYKKYKPPFYLIATDSNNSLPAALEIISFLRSKKIETYLFHGTCEEVRFQLVNITKRKESFNFKMKDNSKLLDGERFGVIGQPSDWLIASFTNYEEIYKKSGAKIIDISFNEFKQEIENIKKVDSIKFKKYVNEKIKFVEVEKALKIYVALKALINKYSLTGLTVRCFDLLGTIHSTSCLALALLNDEGIVCSCEGDVPALLTMSFVKRYFGQVSFQCNPSYVNLVSNYAYLAHCTLPLKMCSSYSFDTHFESGIGIGIHGLMKEGKITILKFNQNLSKYSVFAGKLCKNLYKNNLCRTQIKVEFNDNVERIISSPVGNHLIVFYGDYSNKVISLLS